MATGLVRTRDERFLILSSAVGVRVEGIVLAAPSFDSSISKTAAGDDLHQKLSPPTMLDKRDLEHLPITA